jgi:hypothetical protein
MEAKFRPGTVSFGRLGDSRIELDLANGLRPRSALIVSLGPGARKSLWLDVDGLDLIINKTDILNVREAIQDEEG